MLQPVFLFCQVIADESADPSFVAADLLSQAEHGTDSQVVLVAVNLSDKQLNVIQVTYLAFKSCNASKKLQLHSFLQILHALHTYNTS